MKRIILAAITVDLDSTDANVDQDLEAGLRARLDEIYPFDDGMPQVPTNVNVAVLSPAAFAAFAEATQVGLEGLEDPDTRDMVGIAEDDADEAREALLDLNGQAVPPQA